jgi:predicted metalloendopeptidase
MRCSWQAVCTTKMCQDDSEKIRSKIDKSASPCDDFYQFACGQYNPEISSDKTEVNEFSLLQDMLEEQLNLTMSEKLHKDDISSLKLVKNFFQACMDKGLRNNLNIPPIKL